MMILKACIDMISLLRSNDSVTLQIVVVKSTGDHDIRTRYLS